MSSDDDEASNDGHSSTEFKDDFKDQHKSYLSSTDDEHESIEESNENLITLTFNDHETNSSDSINFVFVGRCVKWQN